MSALFRDDVRLALIGWSVFGRCSAPLWLDGTLPYPFSARLPDTDQNIFFSKNSSWSIQAKKIPLRLSCSSVPFIFPRKSVSPCSAVNICSIQWRRSVTVFQIEASSDSSPKLLIWCSFVANSYFSVTRILVMKKKCILHMLSAGTSSFSNTWLVTFSMISVFTS